MNDPTPVATDKYRRYRERKRAAGLRQVRFWVLDLNNPEIRAQIADENARLRGHRSETEAMDFIDAATADTMRDIDWDAAM